MRSLAIFVVSEPEQFTRSTCSLHVTTSVLLHYKKTLRVNTTLHETAQNKDLYFIFFKNLSTDEKS